MKKSFLKIFLSVILSICFVSVALLTSACNSDSSNVDPLPIVEPKVVDRTDYNVESAADVILNMNAYDFIASLNGEKESPLKDYMIGDIFNGVVQLLAEGFQDALSGLLNNEGLSDLIGGADLGPYADYVNVFLGAGSMGLDRLPFGSNISALLYSYYDNGYWRSNLSDKEVHSVLNVILSYKPFGSEPIVFTDEELETYGETTIIEVLGYKNNLIMSAVLYSNAVFAGFMDATVNDIADLFSKDNVKALRAISVMYGEMSLADFAVFLLPDVTEEELAVYEGYTVGYMVEEITKMLEKGIDKYVSDRVEQAVAQAYGESFSLDGETIKAIIDSLKEYESEREEEITDYIAIIKALYGEFTLGEFFSEYDFTIPEEFSEVTIGEVIEAAEAEYEETVVNEFKPFLNMILDAIIARYEEEYARLQNEYQLGISEIIGVIFGGLSERSKDIETSFDSAFSDYLKTVTVRELVSGVMNLTFLSQPRWTL